MRGRKHAGNGHRSGEKLIRQIPRTSLVASYETIAEGLVQRMRDQLRNLLKDIGQEFATLQLFLLDEQNTVTLPLITGPCGISPGAQEILDELEPTVLGWKLGERAFLRRVPEEYGFGSYGITEGTLKSLESEGVPDDVLKKLETRKKDEPTEEDEFLEILSETIGERNTQKFKSLILRYAKSEFIACIRLTEAEIRKEKEIGNITEEKSEEGLHYYYFYTHKLCVNESELEFGEQMGIERVSLPLPIVKEMRPWTEKIIITGKRWPSYGDFPGLSNVLLFTVSPGSYEKESQQRSKEERLQELKEQLKGQAGALYLLSWFVFYSAFVFQTYAFTQASSDQPGRLRQELSRLDWSSLLDKASKDSRKVLARVTIMLMLPLPRVPRMTSEFEFAKRRALRELAKNHPECAKELCTKLSRFIELSRDEDRSLCFATLRHLKALYPNIIDIGDRRKCLEMVWSKIRELLPNPLDPTTFSLVLSAVEDIYRECEPDMQAEISDSVVSVVHDSIGQGRIDRRLIESLLVAIAYRRDDSRFGELVEAVHEALLSFGVDGIAELFQSVFATLRQPSRETIMARFKRSRKPLKEFAERLAASDDNIRRYEKQMAGNTRLGPRNGRHRLKLVPVVSQKGGTGKTLIAIALATLLACDHKMKVCLIDLDFFGPSLIFLPGLESPQNRGKIHLNRYLKKHFDYWSRWGTLLPNRQSKRLSTKVQWNIPNLGLTIVPCAADRRLQDDMAGPLQREITTHYLKDELYRLTTHLYDEGYECVIFDTPAELKEVTLSATSHSLRHGGVNVFISTLFDPALEPLLTLIPLEYSTGQNCLLINKVRQLERQYVENKTAFVDFLGTRWNADRSGKSVHSEALVEWCLKLEYCGPVAWSEKSHHFLATTPWPGPPGDPIDQATVRNISESMRKDLAPVMQLIVGTDKPGG